MSFVEIGADLGGPTLAASEITAHVGHELVLMGRTPAADGVALLAIGDFGFRIADWVVGIGVRETGSGGWRLLECAFWVVHETRIQPG